MQCPYCGQPFGDTLPSFCPNCGQSTTAPAASQQTQTHVSAPDAAHAVAHAAAQVATGVKEALEDPRLLERIPGRSVSIAGLALMALAILLSMLPWFSGIGLIWSLIMLAGGAAVALQELRLGGIRIAWLPELPASLYHPLIPPAVAILTAVHAFQLLRFGVVPLLWLVSAALLCYDQYRKAVLAPGSFGQYFDLRLAGYGYRRYILLGAAICLVSLFFTWGKTSSYWTGGLSYRYIGPNTGSGYVWDPTLNFWPGFEWTGRNQSFVVFIEMLLLGLVGWSAFRGRGTVPAWFNPAATGVAGLISLWWLVHIQAHLGPWIFLLGLALVDFAVVMIYRGQHTGPYDLEHLVKRQG